MRLLVLIILLGIVGSLGSALFSLARDAGKTDATLKALKIRIGLSVGLFALLFLLYWAGIIQPNANALG
ncbi:MAG: twin transmembrane helix small protein [Pseudomonadota bacterium]